MAGTPDSSFHTLATGDRLLRQPRGLLCPQLATSPRSGPSGQFRAVRVRPPAPGYTQEPPTPPLAPALGQHLPQPAARPGPAPFARAAAGGSRQGKREGGTGWEGGRAGQGLGYSRPPPSNQAPHLPAPPTGPGPGPGRRAPRGSTHRQLGPWPRLGPSGLPSSPRPGARLPGRPQPPRRAPPPVFLPLRPPRSLPPSSPLSSPSPLPPPALLSLAPPQASTLAGHDNRLASFPPRAPSHPPLPPPITPPTLLLGSPPLSFLRAQSPPPSPPSWACLEFCTLGACMRAYPPSFPEGCLRHLIL